MLLDRAGNIHAEEWKHLANDEPAQDADSVTVSLKRWRAERARLKGRNARTGLRLPNDARVETLAADIGDFPMIVLDFPKFTDGRAYSQARILRGRLGYKGELRAGGNVLRDQLLFMKRCGFDSFEVDGERAAAENWAAAFGEFDLAYQAPTGNGVAIPRRRLGSG
jgi:uncharacterized protein (DUF934 family)